MKIKHNMTKPLICIKGSPMTTTIKEKDTMNHDFQKEHMGGRTNQMGSRDDWKVEKECNCILISKGKKN